MCYMIIKECSFVVYVCGTEEAGLGRGISHTEMLAQGQQSFGVAFTIVLHWTEMFRSSFVHLNQLLNVWHLKKSCDLEQVGCS